MKFSTNICGFGFVGGAIGYVLEKNKIEYNVYDVIEPKTKGNFIYYSDIKNMISNSEKNNVTNIYFISVPTPSDTIGNCDTSIVESVVKDLSYNITKKSIILVKSTVRPGTTRTLYQKYSKPYIDIIFCPEFLRELTAKEDMYNANFALFGNYHGIGTEITDELSDLFKNFIYKHKKRSLFDKIVNKKESFKCITKNFEEMELFKYTINTFLAVKVWYFNEIYEICEKFNINYQNFKVLFPLEPRIGKYGTTIPGDDGRGFSKKCLPKETRGMRQLQKDLNIPNYVLNEILERNDFFRSK